MLIGKNLLIEIYHEDLFFQSFLIFITTYCIIITVNHNLYYRKKIKHFLRERDILERNLLNIKQSSEKQQQVIRNMTQNAQLMTQTYEHEITHLKSVITGMHIYIAALNNKNLSQLRSQDLHCLIEFYKEIDVLFAKWIEDNTPSLTNREMTICILMQMGKGKQEIMEILHCSDGSYRTIKNRIKSKLSSSSSKFKIQN